MVSETSHDVFLSHHSLDKAVVERLARRLLAVGMRPWLDKWELVPGERWLPAIERGMQACSVVAVLIGRHGLGRVQALEREAATGNLRMLPVWLPGAPLDAELPPFLGLHTWVDWRDESEDGFERLLAGIHGTTPGPGADPADRGINPYRGLEPFREEHAPWFFGREEDITDLLEQLRTGKRFLTVVGASGSGKSSLVLAGLVPAVRTGQLDGTHRWRAATLRPGSSPCRALAAALVRMEPATDLPDREVGELRDLLGERDDALEDAIFTRLEDGERLLLVVDQLEELFTLTDDGGRRRAFLRNLRAATAADDSRLCVVSTLRADFLGKALADTELGPALQDSLRVTLSMMQRERLEAAIREPARLVGLHVAEPVVDSIVAEVEGRPADLPALEFALHELWRNRSGARIGWAAYESMGGVKGAVARRADEVYRSLPPGQQENARGVLSRLVHLGEGTEDTRRRAGRVELLSALGDGTADVIEQLVDARLLTAHEDEVEVAHEAVIREWGQLQQWLDADREALRLRQELGEAAHLWRRGGRLAEYLWRGGRLARALELGAEARLQLSRGERTFLEESVEAEEALERERAAAARRRLRLAMSATIVALIAVVVAFVAAMQWQRAREAERTAIDQAALAESRRLADLSQRVRQEDPVVGLLLAREAMRRKAGSEATTALVEGLAACYEVASLGGLERWASRVVWEPNGERLLSVSGDIVQVWSPDWTEAVTLSGHEALILSADWEPSGDRVATASVDGTARIWSADGTDLAVLRGHGDGVSDVAWSPTADRIVTASWDGAARVWTPDGTTVATLDGHEDRLVACSWHPAGDKILTTSMDGTARIWTPTGSLIATLRGHQDTVWGATWAPSGDRILTWSWDATARVWSADGTELSVLRGHESRIESASWSPSGATIATASWDGTARLWGSDGVERAILQDHEHRVEHVSWSPAGDRVLTVGTDRVVRVWLDDGTLLAVLRGHGASLAGGAWSPDGRRIVTNSADRTVRVWELDRPGLVETRPVAGVHWGAWDPTGSTVFGISIDDVAWVWSPNTPPVMLQVESESLINRAAWSPSGDRILFSGDQNEVGIWTPAGALKAELPLPEAVLFPGAWSPTGRHVLLGSIEGNAWIWTAEGTEQATLRGHERVVYDSSWSPTGAHVLTASIDGTVRVWGVDGTSVSEMRISDPTWLGTNALWGGAWNPSGDRILTFLEGNAARVWGLDGTVVTTFGGHEAEVNHGAWSPDGSLVVTASADGTARVWTLQGKAIAVLSGHEEAVLEVAWSPAGNHILTLSDDETVRLWTPDGTEILVLRNPQGPFVSAAFSPDGDHVLTVAEDGVARSQLVDIDRLLSFADHRLHRDFTDEERRRYRLGDAAETVLVEGD